jgi:tetratricopeptide (TPR) repeat protein
MIVHGASFSGRERHCCFLNTGQRRCAEVSGASGLDLIDDGRGLATADWDHDGDLDVWFTNRTGPRVRFMRNNCDQRNFVSLSLEGTTCNRDAIGARVELYLKDVTVGNPLIATVRAGEGFVSQSSKVVHLGLADATHIDRLVVRWPGDAKAEEFTGLQVNRRYHIVQGTGRAEALVHSPRRCSWEARPATAPPRVDVARIVLTQRRDVPSLIFDDFLGQRHTLRPGSKGPCLINLWASWCEPCLSELTDFKQGYRALARAGLSIVALSTDGISVARPGDAEAARRFARQSEFPFQLGMADEPLVQQLQQLNDEIFYRQRDLPLPCSFLVDQRGKLAVIYKGPVSPGQVLDDLRLLTASQAEIDRAATPFRGTPILKLFAPNPLGFVQAYREGGYLDEARAEIERYLQNLETFAESESLAEVVERSLKTRAGDASSPRTADVVPTDDAQPGADTAHRQSTKHQPGTDPSSGQATRVARMLKAHQRRATIQAHQLLAKVEHESGRLDEEIQAHREVVRLQPDHWPSQSDLATALWNHDRRDEAERLVSEMLQAGESPHPDRLTIAGQTLMKFGRLQEAARTFHQAVEADPEYVEARFSLAMTLQLAQQPAAAIAEYRMIMEKNPRAWEAINNLAWLLATHPRAELRDASEAVSLARRMCDATNHRNPSYLDTLAAALAAAGEFPEAVAVAENGYRLARRRADHRLAEALRKRADMYRARLPFRDER